MKPWLVVSLMVCSCLAVHAQSSPGQAEALVRRAIGFARQNGAEKLCEQVNHGDGLFHADTGSETYLFVYDQEGVMRAYGFNAADHVGRHRLDVQDPDGKYYVREIVRTAKLKGRGWVDYKYANPRTGQVEPKSTYVEGFGNLIFCCGIYRK